MLSWIVESVTMPLFSGRALVCAATLLKYFNWGPSGGQQERRVISALHETFPSIHARGKGVYMSIGTILLIILILVLVGALPTWPHSRSWGYYPSGLLGVVVVVVLILFLMGRL